MKHGNVPIKNGRNRRKKTRARSKITKEENKISWTNWENGEEAHLMRKERKDAEIGANQREIVWVTKARENAEETEKTAN